MLGRMGQVIKYSAHSTLVFRNDDLKRLQEDLSLKRARRLKSEIEDSIYGSSYTAFSERLFWMRPLARALQRIAKETMLLFILTRAAITFIASWRRALMILIVPAYYLLFQSAMHTEFRYTLPMQYFLFVFAAITWVLVGHLTWNGMKRLLKERQKRSWQVTVCRKMSRETVSRYSIVYFLNGLRFVG